MVARHVLMLHQCSILLCFSTVFMTLSYKQTLSLTLIIKSLIYLRNGALLCFVGAKIQSQQGSPVPPRSYPHFHLHSSPRLNVCSCPWLCCARLHTRQPLYKQYAAHTVFQSANNGISFSTDRLFFLQHTVSSCALCCIGLGFLYLVEERG